MGRRMVVELSPGQRSGWGISACWSDQHRSLDQGSFVRFENIVREPAGAKQKELDVGA